MATSVEDERAKTFAAPFYNSLGFAKTVADAFDQAKAQVTLAHGAGGEIPQLFEAPGESRDQRSGCPRRCATPRPRELKAGSRRKGEVALVRLHVLTKSPRRSPRAAASRSKRQSCRPMGLSAPFMGDLNRSPRRSQTTAWESDTAGRSRLHQQATATTRALRQDRVPARRLGGHGD